MEIKNFNQDVSKFQNSIKMMENLIKEIPLGNSEYQVKELIINSEITPGRKLRTILLMMDSTLTSIKGGYFDLREIELKIRRNKNKINKLDRKNDDENILIEILELKIEKMNLILNSKKRNIEAAFREFKIYSEAIKEFEDYTREKFESEEEAYFEMDLNIKRLYQNREVEKILNQIGKPFNMEKALSFDKFLFNNNNEKLKAFLSQMDFQRKILKDEKL